ncbi:MAG: hypothetical protein WBW48_13705 [Anaerolineae bacterium]
MTTSIASIMPYAPNINGFPWLVPLLLILLPHDGITEPTDWH